MGLDEAGGTVTQLRRPLIATLVLFTGAITLDRLGATAGEEAIATYAYVLAVASLVIPLVSRTARRASARSRAISIVGCYTVWGLTIGPNPFDATGIYTVATEIGFISLAAWLGSQFITAVSAIDEAITGTVAGDSPALDLEGPIAANEIQTELARSRRHDRPMSVTVLGPSPEGLEAALDQTSLELDRAVRLRFLYGRISRTVAQQLRRSDLLFEHKATGRLIVVSPETDQEGTDLLVSRIVAAAARSGIDLLAGTASFPDDGIGFESLVAEAEGDLTESAKPRLRAVEHGGVA
jgi:hypothetical protein